MRISAEAFWAPKAGNNEDEYEDAFCPQHPLISKDGAVFRFAVADGATETSFSGMWATQLVRAFCKGDLESPEFSCSLNALRDRWVKVVSRKPLPWYAEEKVRSGAFAAIVGLILDDSAGPGSSGSWKALAIGDSCLFQLRGDNMVSCFPIQNSEQFNSSPILLSSRSSEPSEDLRALSVVQGRWQQGDAFYLMTDAVACWYLKQVEKGRVPSRELQDLSSGTNGDFKLWLSRLRERNAVRNDDVTIVRVETERV